MRIKLRRLRKEEDGQDLTEYGLLLLFVGMLSITVLHGLGSSVKNLFNNESASLS